MRIAVLGYVVRGPIGGLAWHHLQYVDGLARMGHDVRFVEDSDDYPACYDPARHVVDCDPSYGLAFAADAFGRLGLGEKWSYFDAHTGKWMGPDSRGAEGFCRSADVVLNLSGVNPIRDWSATPPVRALVDTDPVFTQVRNAKDPVARARAAQHNMFFTFGENINEKSSGIPRDGFDWIPTRQPIVLSRWPVAPARAGASYTTVMQWQSYPSVEIDGTSYGAKAASFEPYAGLPEMTGIPLEIALGGDNAPLELLAGRGWCIRNPLSVALTPWDYQGYLRDSRGEFTVAKHGYVVARSGWFSERSAAYLASGRPVITQQTGFSSWLPVGEGVLAFETPAEAVAMLEAVERDHERHSRKAREIAEEYFDSDLVLDRLIKSL